MSFLNERFPVGVSRGATGGPEFSTSVVTLQSGYEQRNINWALARAKYDVSHAVRSKAQLAALISFFNAARVRAHSFRYRDWADYLAIGQTLGTGDGVNKAFQLQIKYQTPGGFFYTRPITKPLHNETVDGVLHKVRAYLNGSETIAFSVDTSTGIVTFTAAPADGAVVTADFAFDVHVRFNIDYLPVRMETSTWGGIDGIELVEVRG